MEAISANKTEHQLTIPDCQELPQEPQATPTPNTTTQPNDNQGTTLPSSKVELRDYLSNYLGVIEAELTVDQLNALDTIAETKVSAGVKAVKYLGAVNVAFHKQFKVPAKTTGDTETIQWGKWIAKTVNLARAIEWLNNRNGYLLNSDALEKVYFSFRDLDTGKVRKVHHKGTAFEMEADGLDLAEDWTKLASIYLKHHQRYAYAENYRRTPVPNQISLLERVDIPYVDEVPESIDPLLDYVISNLTSHESEDAKEWILQYLTNLVLFPDAPYPAILLSGVGGSGKGVFTGIAEAVMNGVWIEKTGYPAKALNDVSAVEVLTSSMVLLNEVTRDKGCFDTIKRVIDPQANIINTRRRGGAMPTVDNTFNWLLSGNTKSIDEGIIQLDKDANSSVNRRFTPLYASTPLLKHVMAVEGCTKDEANELLDAAKEPWEQNTSTHVASVIAWLVEHYGDKAAKRMDAYHGNAFRAQVQETFYGVAELLDHLVESECKVIQPTELYHTYLEFMEIHAPSSAKLSSDRKFKAEVINQLEHRGIAYAESNKVFKLKGKNVRSVVYLGASEWDADEVRGSYKPLSDYFEVTLDMSTNKQRFNFKERRSEQPTGYAAVREEAL